MIRRGPWNWSIFNTEGLTRSLSFWQTSARQNSVQDRIQFGEEDRIVTPEYFLPMKDQQVLQGKEGKAGSHGQVL